MSNPLKMSALTSLPEYFAPLAVSAMVLATAFALAPKLMAQAFTLILSQVCFFFSGQAV